MVPVVKEVKKEDEKKEKEDKEKHVPIEELKDLKIIECSPLTSSPSVQASTSAPTSTGTQTQPEASTSKSQNTPANPNSKSAQKRAHKEALALAKKQASQLAKSQSQSQNSDERTHQRSGKDNMQGEKEMVNHAAKGREWLDRTLSGKGKSREDLARVLWEKGLTAVTEVCRRKQEKRGRIKRKSELMMFQIYYLLLPSYVTTISKNTYWPHPNISPVFIFMDSI